MDNHIAFAEKIVEQEDCKGIECRSCPLYSGNFDCQKYRKYKVEAQNTPYVVDAAREYLKFANHMKTIEKHIKEGKTKKRNDMDNIKFERVKCLRKSNGKPYGCFVAYKMKGIDQLYIGYSLCHKDDTFKKKIALKIATSETNSATYYDCIESDSFDIPTSIFNDFILFAEKQELLNKINLLKKETIDSENITQIRTLKSYLNF